MMVYSVRSVTFIISNCSVFVIIIWAFSTPSCTMLHVYMVYSGIYFGRGMLYSPQDPETMALD